MNDSVTNYDSKISRNNVHFIHLKGVTSVSPFNSSRSNPHFGGITVAYRLFKTYDYVGNIMIMAEYALAITHINDRYIRREGRARAEERLHKLVHSRQLGGVHFLGYGSPNVDLVLINQGFGFVTDLINYREHDSGIYVYNRDFDVIRTLSLIAVAKVRDLTNQGKVTSLPNCFLRALEDSL